MPMLYRLFLEIPVKDQYNIEAISEGDVGRAFFPPSIGLSMLFVEYILILVI